MKKIKHTFVNKIYQKEDLNNQNINFSSFKDSKFIDCNFNNTLIKESFINNTIFENCNLSNSNFSSCNLVDVKFINCNLNNSIFNASKFKSTLIENCDCNLIQARGTHFLESILKKITFNKSDFNRSLFENCKFENLKFDFCKMFMFFSYRTSLFNVRIDNSNLVLAKIINCNKINTNISDNNKLLCFFEKTDSKFDNAQH